MKKRLAVLAVLVAGIAIAQVTQLDLNISGRIQALTGGLLVLPSSLIVSNAVVSQHKITRSLGNTATLDFPFDAGCQVLTVGLIGARDNDACEVGLPPSGGAALSAFSCYVSDAGEVSVRQCPAGADPASASYKVRLTSSAN